MKKGLTLVELITVLAVFAAISIPLSKLFSFLVNDIPQSGKFVESNTSLMNALEFMRKDINSAKSFPQSFQQYSADANCLLIERQDRTVCYLLDRWEISRIITNDTNENITWQIPHGKIEWRIRRENNGGAAVEVKKYIELKIGSRIEKKMENSYVFFVGAEAEAIK